MHLSRRAIYFCRTLLTAIPFAWSSTTVELLAVLTRELAKAPCTTVVRPPDNHGCWCLFVVCVDDELTPLRVIPSEAWTQPHGVELYGWVATEVLGTRSKMTKEYLEEILKSNIAFAPNHSNKKERIFFINHRVGDVPDWLRVYDYLISARDPTPGRNCPLKVGALIRIWAWGISGKGLVEETRKLGKPTSRVWGTILDKLKAQNLAAQ
ncbi:hypothetical protein PIB30_060628 [Stylosanthes scabra]|uniref:Uncharacterized protein n=1 Tax=Stylosanthes scabra TaxID=79078 RepID=A0ABU6ZJA7_9FABA|nr:hypothetical protein [Stylosanthes scabra]